MVFRSPWAPSLYCSTVFRNVYIFCYVSFTFNIKKSFLRFFLISSYVAHIYLWLNFKKM